MTIGGVVVAHGRLGEALVHESLRIAGESEHFVAISTDGLSAQEISDKVGEIIGTDRWIIFADSPGTAPTVRSKAVLREGQALITGANLAMLLSFLFHRDSMAFGELIEKLLQDGRRAVEVQWPRSSSVPRDS